MRKVYLSIAGSAVLVASLTACGGVPNDDGELETGPTSGISVVQVPLEDGGSVTCVMYDGVREASLSCDWDEATR